MQWRVIGSSAAFATAGFFVALAVLSVVYHRITGGVVSDTIAFYVLQVILRVLMLTVVIALAVILYPDGRRALILAAIGCAIVMTIASCVLAAGAIAELSLGVDAGAIDVPSGLAVAFGLGGYLILINLAGWTSHQVKPALALLGIVAGGLFPLAAVGVATRYAFNAVILVVIWSVWVGIEMRRSLASFATVTTSTVGPRPVPSPLVERWRAVTTPGPAPAPGMRVFLLVTLVIASILTGLVAFFGLFGEVQGAMQGATDIGSTALVGFFVLLFALCAAATLGVGKRAPWARVIAIIAGTGVSITICGVVLGIPIIVAAVYAPLRPLAITRASEAVPADDGN